MQKSESVLVISIIFVSVLLVFTIAYIFQIEKKTTLREESTEIAWIDRYIQNGYLQEAEKKILDLSRKDLSASSHIRLLKRAWQLTGSRSGDSPDSPDIVSGVLLEKTAENAYKSYPARQDIAAVYLYALLRGNKIDEAQRVYAESEIERAMWPHITDEMQLHSGKESDKVGQMLKLSRNSDAADFIGTYRATGGSGFLLDAVLLLLEAGDLQQAYALMNENTSDRFSPQFRFFLAYDSGHWENALQILEKYPQLFPKREEQLLKADLLMRRGLYNAARDVYRGASSAADTTDWTAAYNLIYLDLHDDGSVNDSQSEEILEWAAGKNTPVIMDIAGLLMAYGQADAVQNLLGGYLQGEVRPEITLLEESAKETVNPERYSSILWRMASQEESPKYAVHLAWFLLGLEDYSELQSLIDYSRKRYGQQSWTDFFQGIIELYKKNYQEAADQFVRSYGENVHWCSAYNAAVAFMAGGKPEAALKQLELAELSADENGIVEVLLKRTELYIYRENYSAAETTLQEIRKYDPDNLQAALYRGLINEKFTD